MCGLSYKKILTNNSASYEYVIVCAPSFCIVHKLNKNYQIKDEKYHYYWLHHSIHIFRSTVLDISENIFIL